jgi:hypothetical protein
VIGFGFLSFESELSLLLFRDELLLPEEREEPELLGRFFLGSFSSTDDSFFLRTLLRFRNRFFFLPLLLLPELLPLLPPLLLS